MLKSYDAVREKYNVWVKNVTEDTDLIDELKNLEGNDEQIYEQFYRELAFGTGGLRGILGVGSNRMNIYTIRKATQGLADYLNSKYDVASVAISFDSRIKSDVFAKEAACVLAANGITVFLFDELQPTPILSFAVRELDCKSGIMVTASHNPAPYNGYKCYGSDGCQMTDDDANETTSFIEKVDIFADVKTVDFEIAKTSGAIRMIGNEVVKKFLDNVEKQQINPEICKQVPLSVIYTPLHGAGNKPVRAILSRIGVESLEIVKTQELPNGNFPTAPYPNPEIKEAFAEAFKVAETTPADLIVATDPDCDRVGIAVRHEGEYVLMSGNEVGILLFHYILSCRKNAGTLPKNPIGIKTIVTSGMIDAIAEEFGCEVINVLTGFKYIGEQMTLLSEKGEEDRYVFGFEESYGYLAGTYARDKDAVVASMLICEMAAFYKKQSKTIYAAMQELYTTYGVYLNSQINATFEGSKGMDIMAGIMDGLRAEKPSEFSGFKAVSFADYFMSEKTDYLTGKASKINLPKSNVLEFNLEKGASLIVRPSGTEPKIKVYITSTGETFEKAEAVREKLTKIAEELLKPSAN